MYAKTSFKISGAVKTARPTALVLLFLFLPFTAQALGLGSLRVNSRIGEPLNLYIELLSASSADMKTLTVELASREDFRRIGLLYPEEAAQVRFEVDGNRGVRMVTDGPVDAAYLHFLVAASWPGGKLVREYTALLDPPLYKKRAPDVKALPATPPARQQAARPRTDTYTVVGGDNLSSIVKRLELAELVSSHQAMMALYDANPRAFAGNINLLKKGAILYIPAPEEMRQLDRKTARAEFSDQLRRYKEERRKPVAPPPAPEPAADEVVAEESPAAGAVVESAPRLEPELEAKPESESQVEPRIESQLNKPGTPEQAIENNAEAAQPEQVQEPQEQETDRLRIGQVQAEAAEKVEMDDGPPMAADPKFESLRDRVTQLDESLMASRLENEELRKTIKGIEQQLAQLTRLLTLENQPLALARDPSAAAMERPAAETTVETEADDAAALPAAGNEAATPDSPDTKLATSEPAAGKTAESKPEPVTTQDKWWLDQGGAEPISAIVESGDGQQVENQAAEDGEQAAAPQGEAMAGTESDPVEETPVAESGASVPGGEETSDTEQAAPSEKIAVAPETEAGESEASPMMDEAAVTRSVLDRSVLDTVKEAPQMIAGSFNELPDTQRRIIAGVGALVVGLGALGLVRRRQSRKQAIAGRGGAVQSAPSEPAAQRPAAAVGDGIVLSLDDDEGPAEGEAPPVEVAGGAGAVDPIAEADAYIAYDHDDQAIQVLQDAWRGNPQEEIGVKLLELHHKHGDRRAFTSLAEELYLQIGGDSPAWAGIAEMGGALNPDNPLFAGAAGGLAAGAAETDVVTTEFAAAEKSMPEAARPIIELDEIGLDDLQPLQAEESAPEKAEGRSGSTLTLEEEVVATDAGERQTRDEGIDKEPSGETPAAGVDELAAATNVESDDELETALDLARAYLDLNEQEIARGFIDEVLRDGTEQQKKIAAELAEKIG